MDFKWILIISGAALAIMIIILIILKRAPLGYKRRESLMSDAENYFYYFLEDFLPDGYDIVPQVCLAACFDAKKEPGAFNRIASKRFDFVIVRKVMLRDFPYRLQEIVMAIELDDKSHQKEERRERDKFVEAVCRDAGLPLLRYDCKSSSKPEYDKPAIQSDVLSLIKLYEKKHK